MKKTTVILLLIALCLLLSCCSVNAYKYPDSRRYTAGAANVNGRIENIDLSRIDGSVTIAYHSGNDVRLSETSDRNLDREDELHWWLDGDTLYVKYAESGIRLTRSLNKRLTVLLPEGMKLDTLKINGVSCDVDAEGIVTDAVEVNTVSGGVRMEDLRAKTVKVDSVSGSVDVDVDQVTTMKVNTVSGRVALRFDREAEDLSVNTVSGNVEITLPRNADVTAKIHTVSGSVTSDLPMNRDGKSYTCGGGRYDIDVETVSGNVRFDEAK